jgi:hypothetical protein
MVVVKIAAALLVIVAGPLCARRVVAFMPFGFPAWRRRAVVFFAVFGYDTLTTPPKKPRAAARRRAPFFCRSSWR